MQRPRRTSEFCEDPQANGRPSRQRPRPTTAPSPAPGTAQKYTRQSRIAVPARTSSVDQVRPSASALIGGLQSNSALRSRSSSSLHAAGPTPLKSTPSHLSRPPGSSSRVLTAEKYRGGGAGSVALHNDKRWVQDQVERITDFLDKEALNGKISGIPTNFFSSRNSGLRQMSVKQFVAICNYFLQYIFGTRFKQITNVEDIAKTLLQIQYPYQVNKSWLKTANTQHSFGNVILLLDFFIDFVPPCNDTLEAQQQSQFPFQQPQECTSSQILDDENMRIPDIEFQAKLLRDTEDGFMLWNKQLDDEVGALQQRTCDELILKRISVGGLNALKAEMDKLEQRLKELEQSRPQIRKQDEDKCNQLEEKLRYTSRKTEMLHDDLESEAKKYKQLQKSLPSLNKDLMGLKNDIQSLKSSISKQICNIEERYKLVDELAQHNHIVQIQESSLSDLQNENHHQQILQSRTMKQLKDQIQKFNCDVRAIEFSHITANTSAHDLQLPLHAEPEDLNRVKPIIETLRESIDSKIIEKRNDIKQFETENAEISQEIEYTLNPKVNSLKSAIATAKKKLKNYKKEIARECNGILQRTTKLEERLQQTKAQLLGMETMIAQKQQDLLKMSEENEQTMKNAEEQYYEIAKNREERINRTNTDIQTANANLLELTMIVEENEKFIAKLKQENGC